MKPVYREETLDIVKEVSASTKSTLKNAFCAIKESVRVLAHATLYSHDFRYGHRRVYSKRGKHRSGTYIPATLKGRYGVEAVAKAIREIETVVAPNDWNRRDLLIHLKRGTGCSN